MDEVKGRLIAFLHELQNVRAKMIDLKSFEKELERMPELLRRVFIALVQRLNVSVEGLAKLAAQAGETVQVIDSLSLPLTK